MSSTKTLENTTTLSPDEWALVCKYIRFCAIEGCHTQANNSVSFCDCHLKNVSAMRVATTMVFPPCSCGK